jgi:hypothetical protein
LGNSASTQTLIPTHSYNVSITTINGELDMELLWLYKRNKKGNDEVCMDFIANSSISSSDFPLSFGVPSSLNNG